MKNLKTKIIILASLISTIGVFGTSFAASLYLDVTPSSLIKNVGNSFNISVNVNTDGSEVYAVEGTISLSNLTCKNITLTEGLVAQSIPTCSNPYFLIGIPKGTNVNKTLFKILVNGDNVGSASILITKVDIMGAGQSLSNVSVGGEYQINAPKLVPVTASTTTSTTTPISVAATSSVVSTSSEVLSDITTNPNNKSNGFIATVLEGLSNIPKRLIPLMPLLSIIILLILGLIFYKEPDNKIEKL